MDIHIFVFLYIYLFNEGHCLPTDNLSAKQKSRDNHNIKLSPQLSTDNVSGNGMNLYFSEEIFSSEENENIKRQDSDAVDAVEHEAKHPLQASSSRDELLEKVYSFFNTTVKPLCDTPVNNTYHKIGNLPFTGKVDKKATWVDCNITEISEKLNEKIIPGADDSYDPRIPLYLMGLVSNNVVHNGGWSSAGVLPAIEMAIQDVNQRRDILTEYVLRVVMRDTECNTAKATEVLFRHIRDDPVKVMVLGGGCSVSTVPIARTVPYFGLVEVAYSAASPELSQRGEFPTFFRTCASDLALNKPTVAVLLHYEWMHVATLMQQDPLFSSTMNQLHYYFTEVNITLITSESFKYDPMLALKNIKRKLAKIIIFNGYEGAARSVFCEAYRERMYGVAYQWIIPGWYNDDWLTVNDTRCSLDQVAEAVLYSFTVTDLKEDLSGVPTISGQTYAEYEKRYLTWPSTQIHGTNDYHPNGYDAVWAIALALNTSAVVVAQENVTVLENGTLVTRPKQLNDFSYGEEFGMSAIIYAATMETYFHGVSGNVKFNLGDRTALCDIGQYQDTAKSRVAIYDETTMILTFEESTPVQWAGNGPTSCIWDPVFVVLYDSPALITCIFVLAGLGILLSVAFLVFNIKHRDHLHIKMSSPHMNNLIVLGCLLAYVAIILLGLDTQFVSSDVMEVICCAQVWVACISFALAFGAMLAKTWRVHRIFTRPTLAAKAVKDVHLFGLVGALILIDVIILTCWMIFDRQTLHYSNSSEFEGTDGQVTVYQLEYCSSEHKFKWILIVYIVKGLLLALGCFLAYETRRVRIPGLNDSKYICICVYNVLVTCVVAVTVSIVLKGIPNITYALQSFCVFFSATTTLCLLFGPKVKHVLKNPDETKERRRRMRYANDCTDMLTGSSTFQYTMRDMQKKDSVSGLMDAAGYDCHPDTYQDILKKKESELSELRRTHWSLQRAIRGLSSHSTNEAQTQTSMTAKDENISYSYPMRHRAKQDPKTPDYGIDNPTYM